MRPPFWVLAMLIGSATVGMHIFVPALPMIIAEFRIDPAEAQRLISLYMFIIAGGQLVYGPLSDRFGRKPVLIAALSIFALSGFGIALAQSFDAVLMGRIAQAAGGCAGLVLGRAVVHDTATGSDAAKTIASVNAVLLISPTLAPVLGLWIANTFGWRGIAILLAGLGLITIYGVAFKLTETAASRFDPMAVIIGKYLKLLRRPNFLILTIGGGLTTTTMFVLLTASPFVVMEVLDRPLEHAAFFYSLFVLVLLAGNLFSSRALRIWGYNLTFAIMTLIGTCGAGLFLWAAVTGHLGVGIFALAGAMYTFMAGNMAPLALTAAVSQSPDLRGSATGIFGATQFTFGAIGVTIAGSAGDIGQMAAAVMLFCAGSACVIYTIRWLIGART